MLFRTVCAAILFVASVAYAKENECVVSASGIGQSKGVTIQKVTLSGSWGKTDATVFLPAQDEAEAVIVFSHSVIHPENGAKTDMLPMAYTLARAGGAVIVTDRELIWPPKESGINREGAVVTCASDWMAKRTKVPHEGVPITNKDNIVIREFYAYIGPRICNPQSTSGCVFSNPNFRTPPYHHSVWVPVGETEGGDSTEKIMKDGGLRTAKWLQKVLGLHRIDEMESCCSSTAGL
jgi:hypothetical protein